MSAVWGRPKLHVVPAADASLTLVKHLVLSTATSPPPTPCSVPVDRGPGKDALAIAARRVGRAGRRERMKWRMVTFRIKYRLDPGELLFVAGSVPELGGWDKMHAPFLSAEKEIDFYQAVMLLPEDEQHSRFEYKYFTRRGDGTRRWEAGPNRVAAPFVEKVGKVGADGEAGPVVVWDDRWEKVRVEFSIYYPADAAQIMHITGDPPSIGAWFRPGPTAMSLGPVEKLETEVQGRKWRLVVWMPVEQKSFSYRYILIDRKSGQELWEREPNRRAEFDDGAVVENCVHMLKDVNFVSKMLFDYVPPDMFIGPYPQTSVDVDALAHAGVTAVFNVQTDEDFKHRGIQWDVLMRRYRHHGIKVVRHPIRDFDRDSLRAHLHAATHALDQLLASGKKVYIHCTAGMGRAPACAVSYLCWVKNMTLVDAVAHVKKHRKVAVPNVPVLEHALKEPY